MKRSLFTFIVFIAVALFIAAPCMADVGDILIDADQYQSYIFDQPDLSLDSTTMTGSSLQSIIGTGTGDATTSVLGEAELIEYEPYTETATLSIGDITNTGTTQLHIYGITETNGTTLVLTMDMTNSQNLLVENSMTEDSMSSLMNVAASMSLSVTGADGTTGLAGLNEQIHSYTLNRDDGAYQIGAVRTSMTCGTFPE